MKKVMIIAGYILIIFSIFNVPVLCAQLSDQETSDLFSQAKDFFRQADNIAASDTEKAKDLYLKSVMRFERIIKEGNIHNGKLYYNAGNAYFRINDLGHAILYYRRAMQYMPDDPNLKQNIEYARGIRFDKIEEQQKTKVFKTLFFWHYDLSVQTRMILFELSFFLIWLFASIRLYVKKSFLNRAVISSAVFFILMLISVGTDVVNIRKNRPGVIIAPEVYARKGNSSTYEKSFKEPLHSGTEFILIEERKNWYHIKLLDSRTCWVPEADVNLVR